MKVASGLCILLVLTFGVDAESDSILREDTKHAFRKYTCLQNDELELADCRLTFSKADDEEATTITDSGCFIEKVSGQELRSFCPLQCYNASFAYIWSHSPTPPPANSPHDESPIQKLLRNSSMFAPRSGVEQECEQSASFGVTQRRRDWFLWRAGDCLSAEAQFNIGCVFSQMVKTRPNSTIPMRRRHPQATSTIPPSSAPPSTASTTDSSSDISNGSTGSPVIESPTALPENGNNNPTDLERIVADMLNAS